MKRFTMISMLVSAALVISACGGTPAEPTLSPEDIQSTSVAAAFTIIAETQAAIPTNTPLPPTNTPEPTPLPSNTPEPSPTTDAAIIPTFTPLPPTASVGGDPCNKPLTGPVDGHPTKIRLVNETKGSLVISLYLNLTPFGECGYRGYNLERGGSTTITDLVTGCYNVSVFVTEPNKNSKSFGYGCLNNSDLWTIRIFAEQTIVGAP